MERPYTLPKVSGIPFPDLLTLIGQQHVRRPLAQIIREQLDAPADVICLTWGEVMQHAQNAASGLRKHWADSVMTNQEKGRITQPRVPGSPPVVIGLLAKNGYELYINILAALLNRWTVLLISPENSLTTIEHLLRISKCALLLVEPTWHLKFGRTMERIIPGLIAQTVATLDPPAKGPAPSPLAKATQQELAKEMDLPAFYLQTSGVTESPEVVSWSHEFILSGIRRRQRDSDEWLGLPLYCMPPINHAIGMMAHFMWTPAHGNLMNFGSCPDSLAPSCACLLAHLPFIKDSAIILPAAILEDLYALGPEAVKRVAETVKLVEYFDRPPKDATGNALVAAGMHLTAGYTSAEIGIATTHALRKKPEHWSYVSFHPGYTCHFLAVDDHSESGLRELIIGPGTDGHPAIINHERPRGYATNVIWQSHPNVPNLWRWNSRKGRMPECRSRICGRP